ncbi:CU044_5270 family protein [Streptomyces sp. LP11]|uniref:CU044_5270 family protein n=1 Tax=Streptomyces pyxinicus TaxID=2970331 RepID=A0ABT2B2F2_9ACTN|nr:CU044_5270 family protein [Streptomyces sp. LP11]MCS0602600.1 CU044_5270 family protein [Streptomyces sp. LP11]
MPDELDLLRRANPVPADAPHFGDGPLDPHAERHLDRLLHHTPPPRRFRLPRRTAPYRTPRETPAPRRLARLRTRTGIPLPRPRPAWALAAAGAVLAATLTAVLVGPGTQPALAAPRPLTVRVHSTPVPLARMAELAAAAAQDGSPRLRKGTHVQSWSLGMADGEPPVTLPEERVVRWRADAGGTEVVVATDPRHPGRPVLTDTALDPHVVADGQVISRTTYPPSWSDAPPAATPPHTPAALRTYLGETVQPGRRTPARTLSTDELLDGVDQLLDHWTLGARESAALVRLLADSGGLRPLGEVTDRLGRRGEAYAHQGGDGHGRRMLILDPRTGAVLGMETTFTRDDPRYGVKAGDVMEYKAWMR